MVKQVTGYEPPMEHDSEKLARLKEYYDYHKVEERFDLSFHQFYHMNRRGDWATFVEAQSPQIPQQFRGRKNDELQDLKRRRDASRPKLYRTLGVLQSTN